MELPSTSARHSDSLGCYIRQKAAITHKRKRTPGTDFTIMITDKGEVLHKRPGWSPYIYVSP
jgi:hypothetical protein